MMSDTPYLDRCAICNGTREEHNGGTRHMFTTTPGDLRLPPRAENVVRKQNPVDPALAVVSRLIEVLVDRDIINKDEALSCFGIRQKEEPPSGVVNVDEQPESVSTPNAG